MYITYIYIINIYIYINAYTYTYIYIYWSFTRTHCRTHTCPCSDLPDLWPVWICLPLFAQWEALAPVALAFLQPGRSKKTKQVYTMPNAFQVLQHWKCNDIDPPSNPYQSLALFFSAISLARRNTSTSFWTIGMFHPLGTMVRFLEARFSTSTCHLQQGWNNSQTVEQKMYVHEALYIYIHIFQYIYI